jgi:hypothetical protein
VDTQREINKLPKAARAHRTCRPERRRPARSHPPRSAPRPVKG